MSFLDKLTKAFSNELPEEDPEFLEKEKIAKEQLKEQEAQKPVQPVNHSAKSRRRGIEFYKSMTTKEMQDLIAREKAEQEEYDRQQYFKNRKDKIDRLVYENREKAKLAGKEQEFEENLEDGYIMYFDI